MTSATPTAGSSDPAVAARDLEVSLDEAVDHGRRWLLERMGVDGAPECGDEGAYRLPLTLLMIGCRPAAAKTLSWMEREVLTPDGDLRDGPMRTAFGSHWSSYPLAIIAQAAWHLDRYATAGRIVRTLRAFQDPETGGAYAQRPEIRRSSRQDLFPTAQLGITAITVGDREMADGARRWLARLWTLQPELPHVLYTGADGPGLITEPGDDPRERFGLVTDFRARRQAFYNPGIAAAFLARYAAARPDAADGRDAAELAASYLSLTVGGGAAQFDHTESVQICKFGWGAAALLDLTGRSAYRDHVRTMARWFITAQQPDGHWDNSPSLGPSDTSAFEVTAEFLQHLTVMASALAGAYR